LKDSAEEEVVCKEDLSKLIDKRQKSGRLVPVFGSVGQAEQEKYIEKMLEVDQAVEEKELYTIETQ